MADYVDVDTDVLKSAATSYESAADHIRRVGLNFGNVVSRYSFAFGNDGAGKEVDQQFSTLSRGFHDSLHLFATAVDETADGIDAMARQYDRVEERNSRLANGLDPALSDPDSPTQGPPGSHNPPTGNGGRDPGSGRRH